MKKLLLTLLSLSFVLHGYTQVNMQGTIKPGNNANTVDIYLKPSASFSQKDEAMTFALAIPATVSPAPSMGSSGVTVNGAGPVVGITGLQPEFIVNNLAATQREVVTSTETINETSYYVYTFIFAGTAASNYDWTAGVERQVFSIQFNGCTSNCNLSSQLLVNLPNGGANNISYWYVQPNTLGDITNYPAPFYANTQSGSANNGGSDDGSALSTLALMGSVSTYFQDLDNDGYGNASVSKDATKQPAGYVTDKTDCNDNDNTISPAAQEVCDKKDNNCNGQVDESLTLNTYYQDGDDDGYGIARVSLQDCLQPAGYVSNDQDCDDTKAGVHPGITEGCDGTDNNCNGQIDEGLAKNTYYKDGDGDGFGNPSSSFLDCKQLSGYVTNNTDCNDNDAAIHPGANELCDGKDNNCNDQTDEGIKFIFYQDLDNDGFGNANLTKEACSQPAGYRSTGGDCNDNDNTTFPGAAEVCDSKDNNCNGQVDEGFTRQTYYLDADGDGFGDPANSIQACSKPTGYVINKSDNCPAVANPDQKDLDRDGLGDACDPVTNIGGALDALEKDINLIVTEGWKNGLISKLNAAKASCAKGNSNAAANELGAFINQVNAKRGKGLTNAQADDLIARANAIITSMNNGKSDCGKALNDVTGTRFRQLSIEENESLTKGIMMQAIPNPSGSYFTLWVRSNNSNLPMALRVIDQYGRVVEDRSVNANSTLQIGSSYRAGVYFAELTQGKEKVIIKLIKY